jgi:SNF2 family DNA or RNA helicase
MALQEKKKKLSDAIVKSGEESIRGISPEDIRYLLS